MCVDDFATGGRYCLGFGGATVDQRLGELIVKVISPRGLDASIAAIERSSAEGSDRRAALQRQVQQVRYEAERAFTQYDQVDPTNRLVAEVLEQRWNAKLDAVHDLERALAALSDATPALGPADEAAIRTLGKDFVAVWEDPACPVELKKKIARTLIHEIVVDLDEAARELSLIVHWHGGCHIALTMPKPQSGAVAHKTALEDVELIDKMAHRYGDDEIARVLSKLGRVTGKGNRWTQSRVASVRRKHRIAPPNDTTRNPDILTLAQATRHSGVSDTTLMRLIKANVLVAQQIAPYAPFEIQRADLDAEPVAGILERLKVTGKLVLDGDPSVQQQSLFAGNQ